MIAMLQLLVILSLTSTGQAKDGCITGSIRLVGGVNHNEGRLEACFNGRWGTVCGEGWTNEDAGTTCSRLGYPEEGATISSYGQGNGSVYNITCIIDGINCRRSVVTPSDCPHSLDLGVRCQTFLPACNIAINEARSSLTTPPPVECPTLPPTMETTPVQYSMNVTNIKENIDCLSTVLGLGVFSGLTTVALVTVIIGWIITCVYCQQKMKTQLTKHTPSQPPTQTSYPHTDVMYDYIDKIPAPPPGSCDLTTNEAYDSVVQCVTNDSYSVIKLS